MTDAERTAAFKNELLTHIKAHVAAFAEIAYQKKIAGFVFKELQPEALAAARALGWEGKDEPWQLSPAAAKKLAATDHEARAFVQRSAETPIPHILVLSGNGSLLVVFTPGRGFEIVGSDARTLN